MFNLPQFLDNKRREKSIGASLRPDDILAKPMPSKQVQVNQLVLKVSAPKRTGRKRKRGSNGPFIPEAEFANSAAKDTALPSTLDTKSVFRSLHDNPDRYTVEVVGHLKDTHRFRSMPDYQYATSTNTLITKFRDTLMSRDYENIKNFKVDGVKGLPKTQDIGAPPFFSINRQPYNYNYRQNAYVKLVTDEHGQVTTVNVTAPARHIKTYLDPEDPVVPDGPPPELPPESTLESRMREWITKLRAELDKRPMMQRRVYSNIFKGDHELELKRAAGYVGYTFSSGPFKDVLIKFGVDPRSDPKYRFYQAVAFQIPAEGHSAPDDPESYTNTREGKKEAHGGKKRWVEGTHKFDGTKFYRDGKIWQVCDITEPFLKELMETAELRSSCDVSRVQPRGTESDRSQMTYSGWYGNGTWSVLRVIMKDMIRCIGEGKTPSLNRYKQVAKMFPAIVTDENVAQTAPDSSGILQRSNQIGFPVDTKTALLASGARAMCMAAFRYSKRHKKTGKKDGDGAGGATGEQAQPPTPGRTEMEQELDDADGALIGLDSAGEDEQDEEEQSDEDEVE